MGFFVQAQIKPTSHIFFMVIKYSPTHESAQNMGQGLGIMIIKNKIISRFYFLKIKQHYFKIFF
jgi:hypothetical protein